jgi:hypothetical protein
MKKMIIVAALIVAGAVANAASFKWTGANIYGADGAKYTGAAEMYAYLSTATAADAVKVTDIAINNGTIVAAAGSTTAGFTYNWSDATVGASYNFYMVITDDNKQFSTAELLSKAGSAQATSTTTVAFANMADATKNAANWQSAAVPEPTSGLLMLVGLAGLALRRRRA